MLFNSLQFFIFFFIVYWVYRALPEKKQNYLLLGASYFFYASWDWRFLFLMMISTLIAYITGLGIAGADNEKKKKQYLALNAVANLSILAFFKYFNFFIDSFTSFLQFMGLPGTYSFGLNVILPVGISFYTFQTMSYAIDVYRKEIQPTKNMADLALFVSFFPQLVAGPIERAKNLLPQVQGSRKRTAEKNQEGLWLILWGLFKKVVIADNVASIVNTAFDNAATLTGPEAIIAVYAFSVQIYCDFSGYSDIARGTAKLLGFDIMVNFRLPFLAKNPSDFWRRWHISLSTWLRDYLYIPLGGSRGGTLFTWRNLMITMILGGLWHGAAWTFVLWGLFHGLLLVCHRMASPLLDGWTGQGPAWNTVRVIITFQFMAVGWLIFRAENIVQLRDMLTAILWSWPEEGTAGVMFISLMSYSWPLWLMQICQAMKNHLIPQLVWPQAARAAINSLLIYLIFIYGSIDGQEFIYFQF